MAGTWVGIDNFHTIFTNKAFELAAKNTIRFELICLPLLLGLSLLIALALYRYKRIGQFLKSGFLIPMAIPVASVVLLWQFLFDSKGFINGFISKFGLDGYDWMNSGSAFWVLVFAYVWKNIGFNIIIWLAGLSSISPAIYEAARMDGASEWQCFLKITLPNLLPTIYITFVLSLLNSFKVFREAYLIAGDYPHESIYMLQHTFNNWFRDLSLEKMSAGAVIVVLVLIVPILLFQRKQWSQL